MSAADDILVRLEDAISNIDYPGTDADEWTHKAKQAAKELHALVPTKPMYAWSMIGTSWSDDPYYVASGRPGRPVTVVATERQEAINEAARMLGDAGSHRHWQFTQIKAKDLRLMSDGEEEKL